MALHAMAPAWGQQESRHRPTLRCMGGGRSCVLRRRAAWSLPLRRLSQAGGHLVPGRLSMKVTLERAALLKSLGHVHRVVERRNTIPILSNVLLSAEGGALQLKATDLDLEIVESSPAEIGMAGSTTVPAHTLYDIVRKAARRRTGLARRRRRCDAAPGPLGAVPLHPADPAAFRLSRSGRRRVSASLRAQGRRSAQADREDAVRHLDRGDAVLSERHLSPHARRRRRIAHAGRRDRRPPPGARRARRSRRVRRHARRHSAAQDGRRNPEAPRRRRADRADRAVARQSCAARSGPWC